MRDLIILLVAIPLYWLPATAAANSIPAGAPARSLSLFTFHPSLIFFLHALWLALTHYRTYYRVRCHLHEVTTDSTIRQRIRFMATSCHLIIFFGFFSIALTAAADFSLSDRHQPFALLLFVSVPVFIYITVTLMRYGRVSEHVFDALDRLDDSWRGCKKRRRQ